MAIQDKLLIRSLLAGSIFFASLPAQAFQTVEEPVSPETEQTPTTSSVNPQAPKASEGVVGLMRFSGDPGQAGDLRAAVQNQLEAAGFQVKGVALDFATASKKVKCRGGPAACVKQIGQWLSSSNKGKDKLPYTYLVYGSYASGDEGQVTSIVIYDLRNEQLVREVVATPSSDDLILPLVLPTEVAQSVQNYIEAPAGPSPEEQQILASLDEGLTPEDIAAEKLALEKAEQAAASGVTARVKEVDVDLRKDFAAFCRKGPRAKRESKEDPKDLSPSCKLGPFFGYWQPRAWVALGLTASGLVTMTVLYGMGLGKLGPYNDAKDALEAANLDPTKPANSAAYVNLASDVAEKGRDVRRLLIGGDIALLSSVLLAGVLGIIIYQDRKDAKSFISAKKELAGLQRFQVGPLMGEGVKGASFGFKF